METFSHLDEFYSTYLRFFNQSVSRCSISSIATYIRTVQRTHILVLSFTLLFGTYFLSTSVLENLFKPFNNNYISRPISSFPLRPESSTHFQISLGFSSHHQFFFLPNFFLNIFSFPPYQYFQRLFHTVYPSPIHRSVFGVYFGGGVERP